MTDQAVDTTDFGKGPIGQATRWISEIELAERYWQPYIARANKILQRYEDLREGQVEGEQRRKFAILWSNIETLKPACYARVPKAVVLRRFQDADPVGRIAAEVLERAINFGVDAYDFDQVLKDVRDEFLLLAKGHAWIRYVPTFEQPLQTGTTDAEDGADGAPNQLDATEQFNEPKVTYEEVICDYVSYQDFLTNKCRKWSERRWVGRKCYLDREALKKRFRRPVPDQPGKVLGDVIPLDYKPDGKTDSDNTVQFQQAVIYEIWDIVSRKAYWISKSWPAEPLDEVDDPLELEEFFPCPKPAFGTTSPREIIPIPDYAQYQDQAGELDEITMRISILTKAVRMVGLYAGDERPQLQQVFKQSSENSMIPVDTWAAFKDKGGVQGVIEWVPVDMVLKVLNGLYEARDQTLRIIYEVTGISDIMRGDTEANETAAAQQLKSTWGSSRVREKQKEMARFCRDSMRIKGTIIAKKFSIDTLKAMTNIKLLTRQEKEQIAAELQLHQQRVQSMQQQAPQMPGQPPAPPVQQPQLPPPPIPPEAMELMDKPSWEDVDELLKSDGLRQFRIDIETDATVEPDLTSDKRDATEFAVAIGNVINSSAEAVKAAPPLGKVVAEMVKYLTRRFQAGREMEETVEKAMNEIAAMPMTPPEGAEAPKGPSPQELAIEQERVKVEAEELKVRREEIAANSENNRFDAQTNALSVQAERERTAADERIAAMELQMQRMSDMLEAMTRRHETNVDAGIRRYEADSQPAPSMNGAGA